MIKKFVLTIKIKTNYARILHLSVLPENTTAPNFIKIKQHIDDNIILFELETESIKKNQLLSIKNTVDDFISSIIFSQKTLSIFKKFDNFLY